MVKKYTCPPSTNGPDRRVAGGGADRVMAGGPETGPPTSLRETHTGHGDRDLGHGDKGKDESKKRQTRADGDTGRERVTAEGAREELDPWRQVHCAGEKGEMEAQRPGGPCWAGPTGRRLRS